MISRNLFTAGAVLLPVLCAIWLAALTKPQRHSLMVAVDDGLCLLSKPPQCTP